MTIRLTSFEIHRNAGFDGSPLQGTVDPSVACGLAHLGSGAFSEAEIRAQIVTTKAQLASGDWDPSCQYDRRTIGELYRLVSSLEALADFVATHGSTVRRLEETRPRPATWGAQGARTIEVAARVETQSDRGRAAQRHLALDTSAAYSSGVRPMTAEGPQTKGVFSAHALAQWRPDDGVTRMHRAASEALRILASSDPESLDARRANGDATLGLVRRGAANYFDLFREVLRTVPGLADQARARLSALRELCVTLPSCLGDYLPADARWASFRSASTQLAAKRLHLNEQWAALHAKLAIPDFVRTLRRTAPKTLASPSIQRKLEGVVTNGLVHLAFDAALTSAPRDEWLTGFFAHTLPGHHGVRCVLDPASKDCKVTVDPVLLASLFSEIIANATDATQRRRLREGTHRSNETAEPLVRVEPRNGLVRVTIVDAGDPADYRAHAMLGGGTAISGAREGFGIGRLRIRLLAAYLGYSVAYRPLRDGSGSAIEVDIPLS